eukprot:1125511-Rhodomonas_salina.1
MFVTQLLRKSEVGNTRFLIGSGLQAACVAECVEPPPSPLAVVKERQTRENRFWLCVKYRSMERNIRRVSTDGKNAPAVTAPARRRQPDDTDCLSECCAYVPSTLTGGVSQIREEKVSGGGGRVEVGFADQSYGHESLTLLRSNAPRKWRQRKGRPASGTNNVWFYLPTSRVELRAEFLPCCIQELTVLRGNRGDWTAYTTVGMKEPASPQELYRRPKLVSPKKDMEKLEFVRKSNRSHVKFYSVKNLKKKIASMELSQSGESGDFLGDGEEEEEGGSYDSNSM